MTDKQFANTVYAVYGAMGLAGVLYYGVNIARNRKKLKKIKAWEAESLRCIEQSQRRLNTIMEDPTKNIVDVFDAWKEEQTWLNTVTELPEF